MIDIFTGFASFMSAVFTVEVTLWIIALTIIGTIFVMIRSSIRDRSASGGVKRGTRASDVVAAQQHIEPESPQVYSWADIVSRSEEGPDTEEFEMRWEDDGQTRRETTERATGSSEHGTLVAGRSTDTPGSVGGPGAIGTNEP
jgi:hypothetical protein